MFKIRFLTIKTIAFSLALFNFINNSYSQTVEDIKSQKEVYLWGESSIQKTVSRADKEALSMLISQVSTSVQSEYHMQKSEVMKNGKTKAFKENFNSVISTYSKLSLRNTERIITGKEPRVKVFRYIKRSEIKKIFQEREAKIIDYVKNANRSILENKLSDGLKYYYWAMSLLKTVPSAGNLKYLDTDSTQHLLISWLPSKINSTLANIQFNAIVEKKLSHSETLQLTAHFNGNNVVNLSYKYWNGTSWSNLVGIKDGHGIIELDGAAIYFEKIQIQIEYIFKKDSRIDEEVYSILSSSEPIKFRNSYYSIPLPDRFENTKEDNTLKTHKNISISSFKKRLKHQEVNNKSDFAIIRIVTAKKGFEFNGDISGIIKLESRLGEYLLYIPDGSTNLSIMHKEYGVLRRYSYPIPIQGGSEYEMQLSTTESVENIENISDYWKFILFIPTKDLNSNIESREKLNNIAEKVAKKLMNCCTTWGGKDFSYTINWGIDNNGNYKTRVNTKTHELIINMTVQWRGSISGSRYFIEGRLLINLENNELEWIKTTDSGGFVPGCGTHCRIN
jgi:hypothetical protein